MAKLKENSKIMKSTGEETITTVEEIEASLGNVDNTADNVKNVLSATKLTTARNISLTGDATGSVSFDGSQNATITIALVNSGATAGTYTKLIIDAKGRVISATTLSATDIPTLTLSKISDAGSAASKTAGNSVGNVPLIGSNGKLDASVMPAIAISDTFVIANQTAMLALTAQIGDVAVRTDLNKCFILRVEPASTLANWQELLTPTDLVSSVAGKTGVVTLSKSDVGLGNVTNDSQVKRTEMGANSGVATLDSSGVNAQAPKSHTHDERYLKKGPLTWGDLMGV